MELSIKVVLNAFDDPARSGYDWPEQVPQLLADLEATLSSGPAGEVSYRVEETDHGLGVDWPTLTLELVKVGALVIFGIPILNKKVRDAIAGWREIKATVDSMLSWLSAKHPIMSYSIGKVYLDALEHLDTKTDVLELELVTAIEIPGPTNQMKRSFESSAICYYLLAFIHTDNQLYILVYDSMLKLHLSTSVPLSPQIEL